MTGQDRLAGVVVVVFAHALVLAAVTLTPPPEAAAGAAKVAHEASQSEGCASVVTPSCVGDPVQVTATEAADIAPPRSRRCPEPMRRLMRHELEPAPRTEVDLLVAELVERRGDPKGKVTKVAVARPSAAQKQVVRQKRVASVRKLIAGKNSKLGNILGGGQKASVRRNKLGAILGTAKGKKGGNALVSRKGSAYARELKTTVLSHFTVPGNVPPWLRKSLRCRVRITRMTATGRVLRYRVEKKSGNAAFDKAVRRLMNGYKAGLRQLPSPPAHILTAINSRGFVIDFR